MAKKTKKQTLVSSTVVQPVKSEIESETSDSAEEQSGDQSLEVFLWLMAYSVLMFTLPFLGFYGVRNWLDESFPELDTFSKNCYSVLTAVLVVNAIVAMYVLKAVREKDPPALPVDEAEEEDNKKDQ